MISVSTWGDIAVYDAGAAESLLTTVGKRGDMTSFGNALDANVPLRIPFGIDNVVEGALASAKPPQEPGDAQWETLRECHRQWVAQLAPAQRATLLNQLLPRLTDAGVAGGSNFTRQRAFDLVAGGCPLGAVRPATLVDLARSADNEALLRQLLNGAGESMLLPAIHESVGMQADAIVSIVVSLSPTRFGCAPALEACLKRASQDSAPAYLRQALRMAARGVHVEPLGWSQLCTGHFALPEPWGLMQTLGAGAVLQGLGVKEIVDILKVLRAGGVKLDDNNCQDKMSPLHWATANGELELAEALLILECDPGRPQAQAPHATPLDEFDSLVSTSRSGDGTLRERLRTLQTRFRSAAALHGARNTLDNLTEIGVATIDMRKYRP